MIILDTSELQRWGGLLESEVRNIGIRIQGAVAEETTIVRGLAIAAAPRRTGALSGSIRPLGKGLRRAVRAGNNKAFYARFQEFGTRKMAANPFLVIQANAVNQAAFEQRVDDAVGQGDIYA